MHLALSIRSLKWFIEKIYWVFRCLYCEKPIMKCRDGFLDLLNSSFRDKSRMNIGWKQISFNLEPTACEGFNLSLHPPAEPLCIYWWNADGRVLFHIQKVARLLQSIVAEAYFTHGLYRPSRTDTDGLFSNKTLHVSVHNDSCIRAPTSRQESVKLERLICIFV